MKIALVIERMDVHRGGCETSTAQIAEALAARGHEVSIICRSGSWRSAGVELRELGRRGLLRVEHLRNFVADVAEEIARVQHDVVHAMLPVPSADVYQPRGGTVPGQRQADRRRRSAPANLAAKLAEPLNLNLNANLLFALFFIAPPLFATIGFHLRLKWLNPD